VVQAAVEPAQTRDWHESWGKVERWDTRSQTRTATAEPEIQRTGQMPPPPESRRADPLQNPDWYRDMALRSASRKPSASGPVVRAGAQVAQPAQPAPAAPVVESGVALPPIKPPEPRPPLPPVVTVVDSDRPPTHPVTVVQSGPAAPGVPEGEAEVPPGMASVLAAQSPQLASPTNSFPAGVSVPAEEGNAFGAAPPPPPEAPMNAFPRRAAQAQAGPGAPPVGPMAMAMAPRPPSPPPLVDSGVPSGMANAFTNAGTRRPIPADMGPTPQDPNGFGPPAPGYVQGPDAPRPMAPGYGPGGPMGGMAMMPAYPAQAMGYPPMGPLAYAPAAGHSAVMAVPPPPAGMVAPPPSLPQVLTTLKDSLYPSQREWAAERLSGLDWHTNPQVVQALAQAARGDPAATVRAACVHALAQMKVSTVEVVAVVQGLKDDHDLRVRQEADEALAALGVPVAPRQDSGVRPAAAQENQETR
jgi:hypothetical protein